MSRSIQLIRYEAERVQFLYLRSWRIRIVAADSVDQPDRKVFVFKQRPPDPTTGEQVAEFTGVASAYEMEAFPVDAPPADGSGVYFRTDSCDIVLPSLDEADKTWQSIVQQVANLMIILDVFDQLKVSETVWTGEVPDAGNSLSSELGSSVSQSLSRSESGSAS